MRQRYWKCVRCFTRHDRSGGFCDERIPNDKGLLDACNGEIREFDEEGNRSDNVNHPSHYNAGKIEVIEFLEDQQLDFHKANAVKYICRAGRKNPEKYVEDLEKAIWYIRRKISTLKNENVRPNDMPQERA